VEEKLGSGLSKTEQQILAASPTKIGGPEEVISNIPVGRHQNGLFHFTHQNFGDLWHNGETPLVTVAWQVS